MNVLLAQKFDAAAHIFERADLGGRSQCPNTNPA
jgi:hypothetical protein